MEHYFSYSKPKTYVSMRFVYSMARLLKLSLCFSYLSYKLQCCTLPDKRCLAHSMCLYQVMMTLHFLNDIANDAESTQKLKITSYR